MAECVKCKKELSFNEIGANKKFISRNAAEFYCMNCLADKMNIPVKLLKEKVRYLAKMGCSLFVEE